MQRLFAVFLAMICVVAASATSAPEFEDGVLVLTEANFDATVSAEPIIVVEFYAPWCGHCKKLTPEWATAAKQLKASPTPVPLAKVDATIHKSLGERFGVRGYPTIKVFRNGAPRDYKGPRDADGIASYVASLVAPAALPITSAASLASYVVGEKNVPVASLPVVLGLFGQGDESSGRRMEFLNLAEEWRGKLTFIETSDPSVISIRAASPTFVGVIVFRAFDATPAVVEWPSAEPNFVRSQIRPFIARQALPPAGELTPENQELYAAQAQPTVTLFVGEKLNEKTAKYITKRLGSVSSKFPGYTFNYANKLKHKHLIERFAFSDHDVDRNLAIGVAAGPKKFKYDGSSFSAELLEGFVRRVVDGTVEPFVKSEVPPVDNPNPGDGKVVTVTAKSFVDVVLDDSRDVLLELYAPWCGHCKKLAPIYDELAKEYTGVKDLVIAKSDATANDIPDPYTSGGFPTIYWAPKGKKSAPKRYSGDRTVEAFKKFIAENRGDEPKVDL